MIGATEAETTQKDEAVAEGTKQEGTTESGAAAEVAKEEIAKEEIAKEQEVAKEEGVAVEGTKAGASPPADEAGAKRAIDDSAEEPAQQKHTPLNEQKVTKEAARPPRTTRKFCPLVL